MQERLSRRAALAGCAAIAPATALAGPLALPTATAALPRASAAAEPDAELLALGQEFEPLLREDRDIDVRNDDDREEDYEALSGEMFPLADEILRRKAKTREGLAVQVRAMIVTYGWDCLTRLSDDMGNDDEGIANFITSVASFCGVEDDVPARTTKRYDPSPDCPPLRNV